MGILMNMPWLSRDQRQQSIQRLVGSMSRRCTACIQNNGGHTRYWKGTDFAPSAVMYWWDGLSWSKTWHVINKMPMFQLAIVGLFYFELYNVITFQTSGKFLLRLSIVLILNCRFLKLFTVMIVMRIWTSVCNLRIINVIIIIIIIILFHMLCFQSLNYLP